MLSRFQPTRPDVYAVAAHDYLGENTFASEPLDWTHYNENLTVLVYGISTHAGIIHRVTGVQETEEMPEFVNWVLKPRVGDRIVQTRELHGAPFIVELSHRGTDGDSDRLIERVRQTIRINGAAAPRDQLRGTGLHVMRRAGPKLAWWAHRLSGAGHKPAVW